MKFLKFCSIIIFFAVTSNSVAQKRIKLSYNNNQIIITQGSKVCYMLNSKPKSKVYTGNLDAISDTSVVINNTSIAISNLTAIGNYDPAKKVIANVSSFIGGFLFTYFLLSKDYSPDEKTVPLIASGSIIVGALFLSTSTTPDYLNMWKLEIID